MGGAGSRAANGVKKNTRGPSGSMSCFPCRSCSYLFMQFLSPSLFFFSSSFLLVLFPLVPRVSFSMHLYRRLHMIRHLREIPQPLGKNTQYHTRVPFFFNFVCYFRKKCMGSSNRRYDTPYRVQHQYGNFSRPKCYHTDVASSLPDINYCVYFNRQ